MGLKMRFLTSLGELNPKRIGRKKARMKKINLAKNLRLEVKHSCPVKEGVEVWRVIATFISDFPEENKLVKDFFVWVTGEYLEDKAKMTADKNSAEKFALDFVKKRFKESGNQIPIESGVSCSNEEGVVIVNPKIYIHPAEQK